MILDEKNFEKILGVRTPPPNPPCPPLAQKIWPKMAKNSPTWPKNRSLGIFLATEGVFLHFIYTFPTILGVPDRFIGVLRPDSPLFSHFGGGPRPGPGGPAEKNLQKFFSKKNENKFA